MIVRQKSNIYLNASQLLIDKNEALNCSIALAYYSVFVYMKHLLANVKKNPISYEESKFEGKQVHNELRKKAIEERIKSEEWKDLDKRVKKLHDLRVEAEYSGRNFDREEAMKYNKEADYLRKRLKYFYNSLLLDDFK